jgi:hypothetical protein
MARRRIAPEHSAAYGRVGLGRELDRLRQAENGTRNDQLSRAASGPLYWLGLVLLELAPPISLAALATANRA